MIYIYIYVCVYTYIFFILPASVLTKNQKFFKKFVFVIMFENIFTFFFLSSYI